MTIVSAEVVARLEAAEVEARLVAVVRLEAAARLELVARLLHHQERHILQTVMVQQVEVTVTIVSAEVVARLEAAEVEARLVAEVRLEAVARLVLAVM